MYAFNIWNTGHFRSHTKIEYSENCFYRVSNSSRLLWFKQHHFPFSVFFALFFVYPPQYLKAPGVILYNFAFARPSSTLKEGLIKEILILFSGLPRCRLQYNWTHEITKIFFHWVPLKSSVLLATPTLPPARSTAEWISFLDSQHLEKAN